MIGYGRHTPDPQWPGGARVAVQFVINYEEGGENSILHGDAASEAFLSEIVGAAPWPGQRHMNMESIYEYGSRAGFWRLWRLFTERKMPVTVYGVAMALARNPDAVAAMKEANWEIASHGLRWIEYRDFAIDEERRHMAEAIRIHREVTGDRPLGWYTGRSSINTRDLVMEEGGFLYDADAYADDLPYWVDGPKGPHLVVPYTLDANDMRFATPQGFNSGDQFFAYLRDTFDMLHAEGATAPKMMSVGLHCRLAGRPGRALALARFLDHVAAHDRVWVCRRLDIARHWHGREGDLHHHAARPRRPHRRCDARCRAHGRRLERLQGRRRAGHRGGGLWHRDHPQMRQGRGAGKPLGWCREAPRLACDRHRHARGPERTRRAGGRDGGWAACGPRPHHRIRARARLLRLPRHLGRQGGEGCDGSNPRILEADGA
jgi:putative urate catabolism protein